jgi:hypothetical protein
MSAFSKPEYWKFHTSVIEGDWLQLGGVNIWDQKWTDLGKTVFLKDPIYGQDHSMRIYELPGENGTLRFAAGEFSNMVWGIYMPAIKNS